MKIVTMELKTRFNGASRERVPTGPMEDYYRSVFSTKSHYPGVKADWISNPNDIRKLTAFFAWTAWTAVANRLGKNYSYTNNWPPERLADNTITAGTVTWSVISIIGLLGGTGLVFYFFGYDWLGWSDELKKINFRSVADVASTTS